MEPNVVSPVHIKTTDLP